MSSNNHYTWYVLNAIVSIKQHIDNYPLKYKTSKEIINKATTVNRRGLERAFKDVYGYRIKKYLVKQRLEMSKELLKTGITVKVTAAKCFYSSQSSFCSAFKREFDIAPTDWLKTVQPETITSL